MGRPKRKYSKKLRNDIMSHIINGTPYRVIIEKYDVYEVDINRIFKSAQNSPHDSHIFFKNYNLDTWYDLPKDPFDFIIAWMHIQENDLRPLYRVLTDDFDSRFKIIKTNE